MYSQWFDHHEASVTYGSHSLCFGQTRAESLSFYLIQELKRVSQLRFETVFTADLTETFKKDFLLISQI